MILYRIVDGLIKYLDRHRKSIVQRILGHYLIERLIGAGYLTPNGITSFRLVVALIFMTLCVTGYWLKGDMLFLRELNWPLFIVFLPAALSDALDGETAKKYFHIFPGLNRNFGINFDRHVDKAFTLPLLYFYSLLYDFRTRVEIAVLIGGDILATFLAIAANRVGAPIPANELGKAKMWLQCITLGWMILNLEAVYMHYVLVSAITLGVASLMTNCSRFIQNFRASKQAVENATVNSNEAPK